MQVKAPHWSPSGLCGCTALGLWPTLSADGASGLVLFPRAVAFQELNIFTGIGEVYLL